jgi:hypothetical protein
MKKYLLLIFLASAKLTSAQTDSIKHSLTFSGYAEIYYSYDFNKPEDHVRPGFFYSHNRHNEFNLNLGFAKASYSTERVRANMALASGTYMNVNYATEPGVLKNIYEANAGVKLSKKKNIWIDAGIFASHIGFESAVSKDCWTLTRSILADNSPYYESGAKISYSTDNSKWFLSALVLNGWQHIQRPDGNNTPAFGTQMTYTPSSKVSINYSTFIGNEKPDSAKQWRYFHNFYASLNLSERFHVIAGVDYGMEKKQSGSSSYNSWYSPVVIVKVAVNSNCSVAGRAELYNDKNGVIIATGTENGFQTTGYSLNVDYKIDENAVWRIEGRALNSKDEIFIKGNRSLNSDIFVTSAIAISF